MQTVLAVITVDELTLPECQSPTKGMRGHVSPTVWVNKDLRNTWKPPQSQLKFYTCGITLALENYGFRSFFEFQIWDTQPV